MFNQITPANTNKEEALTLERVLDDFQLQPSQRDIISRAVNEILDTLPESEIDNFLRNLREQIEAVREPIVESHIQDIMLAVKAAVSGRDISYYSYRIPPKATQKLLDKLAA